MIIGIDGNEANVAHKVGVSVYTLELLEYFRSQAGPNLQFRVYLKDSPRPDLPKQTQYFTYEVVWGPVMWSQFFLSLRLALKNSIDVFFAPAHYSPRFCPSPLVVTIHDLAFFYYPDEFLKKDLYKLSNWTTHSVRKARSIIAVSKNTKKDLLKFYNIASERVAVIYNGFEKTARSEAEDKNIEKPYFLFTGTLQPRKNISFLIRTFAQFHKGQPQYKLVITGKKGWMYEEIFKEVERLQLKDSVIFTDYIEDTKLADLYKNAEIFILPSLYEGFGVPILEAMSFGCPVLCSYNSSLPEVGGDAAIYFDPFDEKDLLEKMNVLSGNKTLRRELTKKGFQQIKQFSWRKCAEETLQVIKDSVS